MQLYVTTKMIMPGSVFEPPKPEGLGWVLVSHQYRYNSGLFEFDFVWKRFDEYADSGGCGGCADAPNVGRDESADSGERP